MILKSNSKISEGGGIIMIQPKLLDQLRNAVRTKHYSIRTEEAYVYWVRQFILYHNKRHPREMGKNEIRQFLTYLAVNRKVAASTQNQALCALLFLYREILQMEVGWLDEVELAKKPQRLPLVFTREEVKMILLELEGTKWLMASFLYGSGLRLMECLRLRVKDVDFSYNQIVVRDAKGQKDRVTMLPNSLQEPLKKHLQKVAALHQRDIREGFGAVYLPYALERKYPHANREWCWQYVFPAHRRSIDPRSGVERRHHLSEHDLHARAKPRRQGRQKPAGSVTCRLKKFFTKKKIFSLGNKISHPVNNLQTCATKKHTAMPITTGSRAETVVHLTLPVSL